jgi:hypothetical protein
MLSLGTQPAAHVRLLWRLLLLAQTNDENLDLEWMSFLPIAPMHRRLMLATLLLLQLDHMISTQSPEPHTLQLDILDI